MGQPSLQRNPQRPAALHPVAVEILVALANDPAASEVVLGGYFALKHYLDYRETHDINAWWRTRASESAIHAIQRVMDTVAEGRGYTCEKRSFGDTISFELVEKGMRIFSFQIATGSIEIEPPVASPWAPILIETLADNVGGKMNVLVNRGSPRDFTDIARVVEAGLATVDKCWSWWRRKNPSASVTTGKQKARLQLELLERRRPLDTIDDPAQRSAAATLRDWFQTRLLVE